MPLGKSMRLANWSLAEPGLPCPFNVSSNERSIGTPTASMTVSVVNKPETVSDPGPKLSPPFEKPMPDWKWLEVPPIVVNMSKSWPKWPLTLHCVSKLPVPERAPFTARLSETGIEVRFEPFVAVKITWVLNSPNEVTTPPSDSLNCNAAPTCPGVESAEDVMLVTSLEQLCDKETGVGEAITSFTHGTPAENVSAEAASPRSRAAAARVVPNRSFATGRPSLFIAKSPISTAPRERRTSCRAEPLPKFRGSR